MLEHMRGDPVEHVGELRATGHRFELGLGELDVHVEVPLVPAVDDGRRVPGRARSRKEVRHHLERPLGGRQPDALQPVPLSRDELAEPLEGERQMRAALVPGQGVHLVDDHRVDTLEHGPGGRRREEEVEGLRRGDQQVGRVPAHGRPGRRRCVAGAHGHRQVRCREPEAGRFFGDARQRELQVLVHVDGQGPERRDVDHAGAASGGGGRRPLGVSPVGGVDGHQKAGQGLAGPRRRGHEHVASGDDLWPRPTLGFGRSRREASEEPAGHGGVERAQDRVSG